MDPSARVQQRAQIGQLLTEQLPSIVLTYNPKVASVLSYDRFTSLGLNQALPVAAVLVILALIPLAALRALRGDR